MAGARFTIWVTRGAEPAIDGYGRFRSARVAALLDRYLATVGQEKPRLTADEWWTLLRHLWRDKLLGADEVRTLWAKIELLQREQMLSEKIDGAALVRKLKAMSTWQLMAVADVIERLGLMDKAVSSTMSKEEQIAAAGGIVERPRVPG